MVRQGDRVRLTPSFARALSKTHRCRVDWTTRIGIVERRNAYMVYVKWEGRSSIESLLLKAVEVIPVQSGSAV